MLYAILQSVPFITTNRVLVIDPPSSKSSNPVLDNREECSTSDFFREPKDLLTLLNDSSVPIGVSLDGIFGISKTISLRSCSFFSSRFLFSNIDFSNF